MVDNKAFVVLDSVFRLNLQSGFILNRKRLLLEQETVIRRNKNACAVETVDYLGD